jgi:hypothetical protein
MPEDFETKLKQIASDNKKQLDEISKLVEKKADSAIIDQKLQDVQDSITNLEFENEDGTKKGIKSYVEDLQKSHDELALELEGIKTRKGEEPETMEKQIKELSENKEFIQHLKNKTQQEYNIDIKAAMARSSSTADTGTVRLLQMNIPGVSKEPWQETPFFAAINKRAVGEKVDSIRYVSMDSRTNNAAAVAEAGTLAQSSLATKAYKEDFYKVGHYATVSEEYLEDSDFIQDEINDLIRNGLLRQLETYHFDEDGKTPGTDIFYNLIGTSGQLAKDFARPYNFTETVTAANFWNVLSVAKLQVANGVNTAGTSQFKGYNADVAFVNHGTLTEMKTIKDIDGRLLWRDYMDQQNRYDGMMIIPSWDVPADGFIVGSSSTATAYIKRQLTIKTSENVASQFLSDQVSIKATIREAFLIKILERYGWVEGTFTEGKAIIGA